MHSVANLAGPWGVLSFDDDMITRKGRMEAQAYMVPNLYSLEYVSTRLWSGSLQKYLASRTKNQEIKQKVLLHSHLSLHFNHFLALSIAK